MASNVPEKISSEPRDRSETGGLDRAGAGIGPRLRSAGARRSTRPWHVPVSARREAMDRPKPGQLVRSRNARGDNIPTGP